MSRPWLALALPVLVSACIFDAEPKVVTVVGTTTEDDTAGGGCDERSYDVGASEVTDLGFSAADVLTFLAGPRSAELVYADGSTTALTLSVESDGAGVSYTRREDAYGEGLDCVDSLELGLVVNLSTADGAFAERLTTSLSLSEYASGVSLYPRQDIEDVAGTFALERADRLSYVIFFSADATQGEIVAIAEPIGDEDPTEECGVAAWGAALATGCW